MNSAVLKFNKIISETGGTFQGSTSTLQEDIVAMLASKRKPASKPDSDASEDNKRAKNVFPPFVKHFKTSNDTDATSYKLGDSKTWQGATWYFCDCPNHRDRHKWHTHTHETCRTRNAG